MQCKEVQTLSAIFYDNLEPMEESSFQITVDVCCVSSNARCTMCSQTDIMNMFNQSLMDRNKVFYFGGLICILSLKFLVH